MNIRTKHFHIRIGKRECLFFFYTKQHKYGITWGDVYGFDYGRATW